MTISEKIDLLERNYCDPDRKISIDRLLYTAIALLKDQRRERQEDKTKAFDLLYTMRLALEHNCVNQKTIIKMILDFTKN